MATLALNLILLSGGLGGLTPLTLVKVVFLVIWLALLWKLFNTSSHVLMVLLMLEVLMLSTVLLLNLSLSHFFSSSSLLMLFFTLAVCEASLGLGLLIQLSRKTGSDSLSLI